MSKIALITGGSRGLGKSMALHLADKGRDIILTYHSKHDEAEAVVEAIAAKGRKAVAMQLDVSKPETFAGFAAAFHAALQEHWERNDFDYLINNAGMGIHKSFMETSEADFDLLMATHLKGPFFLSQTLLPMMKDGGRVLNITSGLTRFTVPGYAAYATMKTALEGLSRYMAKELGPRGISVNAFAPGAIETDFGGGIVRDNKDLNTYLAVNSALGRVGLPDDIGGAVAALLDDNAHWMTGQRIEASGGEFI